MRDEEFCLLHGRDHMKSDRGPISYCAMCDAGREKVFVPAQEPLSEPPGIKKLVLSIMPKR
jgi:hypothetical protein